MTNDEKDTRFMLGIIGEICDYCKENDIEPDDGLKTISQNILALLKISTFNGWGKEANGKPKSPKELISEVKNEVLSEAHLRISDIDGIAKTAFCHGATTMADALIEKLENNNAEEQSI